MKKNHLIYAMLTLVAVAFVSFFAPEVSGEALVLGLTAPGLVLPQPGGFTRVEETLLNYLKNINPELAPKYANRELRFRDLDIYVKKQIDGLSGTQKIMDSTSSKAVGLCNLDKGRLDKDTAFAVSHIVIGYANSGAGTDASAVTTYTSDIGSWPAGLQSGEIEIWQDNNLVWDGAAKSCGSQADSFLAFGSEGRKLVAPFVLHPEKQIEIKINFASSIAPANSDFIEIFLFGVSTRKRGMV